MTPTKGKGLEYIDALPEDGERRLMLAVLLDALHEFARTSATPHPASNPAWWRERRWLESDDEAYEFSFAHICHQLGLDPEVIRARALRPRGRRPRWAAKAEVTWERMKESA